MPAMTPPMIMVFPFQLCGCPYQPPAGDQTCLGYETLPPPPIFASRDCRLRLGWSSRDCVNPRVVVRFNLKLGVLDTRTT